MSVKNILQIIAIGFIIQGTFFAILKANGKELFDHEKTKNNPKEALKVQVKLLVFNLIFWGIIIFLVLRFIH